MSENISVITAFALYLGLMMYIGIYYYRKSNQLSDYILGGRQLGPWITSLSAEASDMSGWMLMGLPGYAYATGLPAMWIAVGLAVGTWFNWVFIAKRLRTYTEVANDSLTIPDFLKNRFHDTTNALPVLSGIFILIFFLIYTSSGFVAGGKLFHTIFGLDYTTSLFLTAFVIIFYTFLGGFLAVSWTDFIQGCMMFFAILIVPITATYMVGSPGDVYQVISNEFPTHLNWFEGPLGEATTIFGVISSLAWGFGYLGQPHILVRFMAISDTKELSKATNIAMTWVVISLTAAIMVGLVGRVYVTPELSGPDTETVFLIMTNALFSPFVAGLIWSAVLAAIMSTASAQLLVTASVVSKDLYHNVVHPKASEKELVLVSRVTVVLVAAIAIFLALNPDSYILQIVAYAWAGFGAAFGPAILMSLYWRRMTKRGCFAGIFIGGITVILWKYYGYAGLYEIVPGFLASLIAIIVVSLMDEEPSSAITDHYDEAYEIHQN